MLSLNGRVLYAGVCVSSLKTKKYKYNDLLLDLSSAPFADKCKPWLY